MPNYLLYDAGCSLCSDLANRVESEAGGWLTVRSLSDPEMQSLVGDRVSEPSARPRLVMVNGDDVKVLSGARMNWALVRGVGPRRAAAITNAIQNTVRTSEGIGRRGFLRSAAITTGLAVGYSVAGRGLAGASPTATSQALDNAAVERLRAEASANADVQAALKIAASNGFRLETEKAVGVGDGGRLLLMLIFAHTAKPESEAAILFYATDGRGKVNVALERVTQTAEITEQTERLYDVSSSQQLYASGGEVAAMGAREWWACMSACMGADCVVKGKNCAKIPWWQAKVACYAGYCGPAAWRCNGTCRHLW